MMSCCNKIYLRTIILNVVLTRIKCFNEVFNVQMITDLQHYFNAKWIIVHTCHEPKYLHPLPQILNQLRNNSDVFLSVYDWKDFIKYQNLYEHVYVQPMVLLSCQSCENDCLLKMNDLNKQEKISQYIWIALLDNSTLQNLDKLYLPIDSLFITITRNSEAWLLSEIYQTSLHSPYYYNKIGTWDKLNGLHMHADAFEERRSNFFGQNMTVDFSPPPRGLGLKYPLLHLEHFLNITKKLNIKVNLTNKPGEGQLSATLRIMSSTAPDSRYYFHPVIVSRFIIFFKDVKSELLVDSFIRPFHFAVWLAILFWVIIIGYISYQITNLMHHYYQKLPCLKLHQYIFEALSILLQKNETSNEIFISQRITKITQWFGSIIVYSTYSAIFIAFVTVIIRKPPFKTLDGFLKDGRFNIVLFNMNASTPYFTEHKDDRIQRMIKFHYYYPLNQANSVVEAVQLVCFSNENFATLQSFQRYEVAKQQFPNCALSDEFISLNVINFSFTTKTRNSYIRIFQYWLLKLLMSGSVIDFNNEREKATVKKELALFYPIELQHVCFLYLLLFGGIALSFFLFLLEMHFNKLSKKYKNI